MKTLFAVIFLTFFTFTCYGQRTTSTKLDVGDGKFQVVTEKVYSDSTRVTFRTTEMTSLEADSVLVVEAGLKTEQIQILTDNISEITAYLAKLTAELSLLSN